MFLVERLLGTALDRHRAALAHVGVARDLRGYISDAPSRVVRKGIPQGGAAIVQLLIVTVVVLGLAIWRMAHMRMAGASD